MKNFIVALVLVLITVFFTFVSTMNHLEITVNEEANGAMVECFGQVWYHEIVIEK